jgi:hypothetical protein
VFHVVSAVVKLIGEDGKAHAAYAHGALYDSNPEQEESLLSVHQSSGAPTTASMTEHEVRRMFMANEVCR